MKKALKITGRILLILLLLLLLFTLITFIVHRVRTSQETALLKEKGYYNPVSVGDYSLNVAAFGKENGDHTIVSIAGLGMGDYSVAERQMTEALEQDNRVVFVDRAGYGFSDDTDHEMTLDYIVEDYRKALQNAGIEAPYILMAHSIGGAYANYWSSLYPDEIEAVVFVDGSQLDEHAFDDEPVETVGLEDHALAILAKLGFSRYVLRQYAFLKPDNYSAEEQYLCDALDLMTMDSIAVESESCLLAQNGQAAWNSIVTNDIPKLYICASWGIQDTEELRDFLEWFGTLMEKNHKDRNAFGNTNIDEEKLQKQVDQLEQLRQDVIYPYAEKMGNCEVVLLGGDHLIYEQKPAECGVLIKSFIDGIGT
ncbi:MAG: alpha/beta hydrolase [Oscillospiraceae bacterium]|nr:alpha/beta hydrolase [Oscillospiraceae bacterium]